MKNQDKIVLFYGMDPVDGQIKNGTCDRIGSTEKEDFHIFCFREFCKSHFLDIKAFQNLSYRSSIDVVSYFLSQVMGHVVFLNTTKDIEKYGYSGMFFMPPELTEEQAKLVTSFTEELTSFQIVVNYDMALNAGIIEAKTKQATSDVNIKKFIQNFIDIQYRKGKKK